VIPRPTFPWSRATRSINPENSLDFTLALERLDSAKATPTYRTAVGEAVKPGDPDGSRLFELVSSRGMFRQMPPLATERVDAQGVAVLRRWIEAL
jgi:hypothetical protein